MSSASNSAPSHVPPSKQPRAFPSTEQIKELLKNNHCFVRFRESGSSDVWKLFEEVCYKQNNEFTGIIRCTKCNHMARYHGHITGTSHMRRHRCFGELFPHAAKQQQLQSANKKQQQQQQQSSNENNQSTNSNNSSNLNINNSNSKGKSPFAGGRKMVKASEKKSICLENGADLGGPPSKRSNNNMNTSSNDQHLTSSILSIDDDQNNSAMNTTGGNTPISGNSDKGIKIELRTYNNQTVITPKVKNALASSILGFCYSELVNLECVCSNSFKNILKGAAIKVSTPLVLNIHYLKTRAQELYTNEKTAIMNGIRESVERNSGGAIVSDFKDDLCIMSYSYIDQDWKLQDKVLRGATRINNILDFISETLKDYGLLQDTLINKFTYISNAGQLSGVDIHLSSVSHLLDNMVEEVVFADDNYYQLTENCKFICKELKILPENPVSSWIEKFDVIKLVLDNLDRFSPGNFSMDSMLPAMQALKNFLAPFKDASMLMRTDVHELPTINQVALQYFKLQKELAQRDDDNEEFSEYRSKLLTSLEQNFELHMMHKIAVFLWPNFRHLKMFSLSDREEIYSEVRKMIEVNGDSSVVVEECPEETIKTQTQYSEWEAVTEFDQDEVDRYLADKFNHCNEHTLLTWWKEASKRYPKLSTVARSILAIPASVTSIERRHRLHSRPPVDEELLFLHCNLATP